MIAQHLEMNPLPHLIFDKFGLFGSSHGLEVFDDHFNLLFMLIDQYVQLRQISPLVLGLSIDPKNGGFQGVDDGACCSEKSVIAANSEAQILVLHHLGRNFDFLGHLNVKVALGPKDLLECFGYLFVLTLLFLQFVHVVLG